MNEIRPIYTPTYYCIPRHRYMPCEVIEHQVGNPHHQYRVVTLDTGEELLVSDLLTSFETTSEYFCNAYSGELAHLVFAATFSPHQSYACWMALDADSRLFTNRQLALLAEHGYGGALRYRAQAELDERQDREIAKMENEHDYLV